MSRCTTRDCLALSVDLIWKAREQGWSSGKMTYSAAFYQHVLSWCFTRHDGRDCLYYRWGEWESGQQSVYAAFYEEAPAAIGGKRLFWRCLCGRRVVALYMPRGNLNWPGHAPVFACRHCYRLPYASQYESESDKVWRRYHALNDQLVNPETPWRRRDELTRQWAALTPALNAEFQRSHERFERFMTPVEAPRRRGRPSPKRERAEVRAARAAERVDRPKLPPGRPREKRPYRRRAPRVLSEKREDCVQAYCPKCRDRRELVDGKPVTFSNGRPAIQGHCSTCGITIARLVKRTVSSE